MTLKRPALDLDLQRAARGVRCVYCGAAIPSLRRVVCAPCKHAMRCKARCAAGGHRPEPKVARDGRPYCAACTRDRFSRIREEKKRKGWTR